MTAPAAGLTAGSITSRGQHVVMTVTCACGHLIAEYTDIIDEKYPFWCENCDEMARDGMYPWTITSRIVTIGSPGD